MTTETEYQNAVNYLTKLLNGGLMGERGSKPLRIAIEACELQIPKSLKKTPLANAILACTSFAPVTWKPSLTEAVSRFATAIMSRSSRKGRNTKFLILLTATATPKN